MSTLAAFRSPAFRRYQAARVLSILAMQGVSVAVGWQIYDLTHSALDLGLVGGVQFVPLLLLWPLTGTLADRFDRKSVLLGAYVWLLLVIVGLAALAVRGGSVVAPIYALLFAIGIGRAVSGPASSAMLPQLVPPEDFPNAASWSSTLSSVGVIAGPALGGAAYAWAGGAVGAYVLSAGLLTLATLSLATVSPRAVAKAREPLTLQAALVGVRFIRRHPVLLGAITLDLFAVLLGGAVALLPVYARDLLHTGPEGLGVLRAAPAVGAGLTALFLSARPLRRNVGTTLYVTVAAFGLATIAFGLSTSGIGALVALLLIGATDEVSVFIRQNVVQLATPEAMRGRVGAAEFVFIGASNELGELESGLAAAWIGPVAAVVGGGIGTLVVVALSAWLMPALRRVDRMDELRAAA